MINDDSVAPTSTVNCVVCGSTAVVGHLSAPDRFHSRSEVYHLLRCSHCTLVWLGNAPKGNEMGPHYGPLYDRFIRNATDKQNGAHWAAPIATVTNLKSGGTFLDLGCGSGSFLRALDGNRWEKFGVEFSIAAADEARATTGGTIFCGDVLDAPFPDDQFDAVSCVNVLEHMHDPLAVMKRIRRWLKPGGIVFIQVPNIESSEAKAFRTYWYGLELPRHLYHFSCTSLERLAVNAGLEKNVVVTKPASFLEYSLYYQLGAMERAFGYKSTSLASACTPSILWRVVRKALRLSLFRVAESIIALSGEGQMVVGVFVKK